MEWLLDRTGWGELVRGSRGVPHAELPCFNLELGREGWLFLFADSFEFKKKNAIFSFSSDFQNMSKPSSDKKEGMISTFILSQCYFVRPPPLQKNCPRVWIQRNWCFSSLTSPPDISSHVRARNVNTFTETDSSEARGEDDVSLCSRSLLGCMEQKRGRAQPASNALYADEK